MTYVVLLRGINVGGKSKVPMADLRAALEGAGFESVRSYIASGNVLLESGHSEAEVKAAIDSLLVRDFALAAETNGVLVLDHTDLQQVIDDAPTGFGSKPDDFHYDVAFYMGVGPDDVMQSVKVNPEVDTAVAGDRALYFRRLSAKRTKSRMSALAATPVYRSLTIRNWRTVTKLAQMVDD